MNICAVTGVFGYSGHRIAERLLAEGHSVRTLTHSPNRPNPFGNRIQVFPYNFDRYPESVASLRGVSVFCNTYWVRFNHRDFKHETAVQNALTLFRAANKGLTAIHAILWRWERFFGYWAGNFWQTAPMRSMAVSAGLFF